MGAPKEQAQVFDNEAYLQIVGEAGFRVRVISSSAAKASALTREMAHAVENWLELSVASDSVSESRPFGQAVFIDAETIDAREALGSLDRQRDGVYLIVREGSDVPSLLVEGLVDDVLVHPFRALEVLSRFRHFQQLQSWRETEALNASYAQLVERFEGDLELARKLQKSKLPTRFPDVKGFRITSRYLAGTRSGGNYIDLAESRDGSQVAILMTDASNYRLSSALMDVIPRVMSGLSLDEVRSSLTTARRIRDGVLQMLSERDSLALFYGSLSRKDYRLKYVNLGAARVYYASPGKSFQELAGHGGPIVKAQGVRAEKEGEVVLEPEGRFAVVSDGYVQALGGSEGVLEVLNRFRGSDAKDSLNELAFQVKSVLQNQEDLPEQDCTAAIFDIDARLIRLA